MHGLYCTVYRDSTPGCTVHLRIIKRKLVLSRRSQQAVVGTGTRQANERTDCVKSVNPERSNNERTSASVRCGVSYCGVAPGESNTSSSSSLAPRAIPLQATHKSYMRTQIVSGSGRTAVLRTRRKVRRSLLGPGGYDGWSLIRSRARSLVVSAAKSSHRRPTASLPPSRLLQYSLLVGVPSGFDAGDSLATAEAPPAAEAARGRHAAQSAAPSFLPFSLLPSPFPRGQLARF